MKGTTLLLLLLVAVLAICCAPTVEARGRGLNKMQRQERLARAKKNGGKHRLMRDNRIRGPPAPRKTVEVATPPQTQTERKAVVPPGYSALNMVVQAARNASQPPSWNIVEGQIITEYEYLIAIDVLDDADYNSPEQRIACDIDLNLNYPVGCRSPGIKGLRTTVPIYTQGNQANLPEALPKGKYVMNIKIPGFKICGIPFVVNGADPTNLVVKCHPWPLPLGTIRIKVFLETVMVNGEYDDGELPLAGFNPTVATIEGPCVNDYFGNDILNIESDENGDIFIPNMFPHRYDVGASPPVNGIPYIQTSTLEGGHGWDTWIGEGYSGYETEMTTGGDAPFPQVWVAFAVEKPLKKGPNPLPTGGIKGQVVSGVTYFPITESMTVLPNVKVHGPVPRKDVHIALSDISTGNDAVVYIGRADENGNFTIPNLANGQYSLSYWDGFQNYIMSIITVDVNNGKTTDMGLLVLSGWYTYLDGYTFLDNNGDGKYDKCAPNQDPKTCDAPLQFGPQIYLKDRDGSAIDRSQTSALPDFDGYYQFEFIYPLGAWMILDTIAHGFKATGMTYQAENQPTATTLSGPDFANNFHWSFLPLASMRARADFGFQKVNATKDVGLHGGVYYDVVRANYAADESVIDNWEPGIANVPVKTYEATRCDPANATTFTGYGCESFEVGGTTEFLKTELATGAVAKTAVPIDSQQTEAWDYPVNCIPRNARGNVFTFGNGLDQQKIWPVMVDPNDPQKGWYDPNKPFPCLEGSNFGLQFGDQPAKMDGSFRVPEAKLSPGKVYLVEVDVPLDALGKPAYEVRSEENVNTFDSDRFSGVDVTSPGFPTNPDPKEDLVFMDPFTTKPAKMFKQVVEHPCAGEKYVVNTAATNNAYFIEQGGSPYDGETRHRCNAKLVKMDGIKYVWFHLATSVPLPGWLRFALIDDLILSTDPKSLWYGEVRGIPFASCGVYDFEGKYLTTYVTDHNGWAFMLLPSTQGANMLSADGMAPNMYYVVGNDPGDLYRKEPFYRPEFATGRIGIEVLPATYVPADVAITELTATVRDPAGNPILASTQCYLDDRTPRIYAVDTPVARAPIFNDASSGTVRITITGAGFTAGGNAAPVVTLTKDAAVPGTVTVQSGFTDNLIVIAIAAVSGTRADGRWQLTVKNANSGRSTVNGLTIHLVCKSSTASNCAQPTAYAPALWTVGAVPATVSTAIRTGSALTIQAAIDAITAADPLKTANADTPLLVVFPAANPTDTGLGGLAASDTWYYENVIVTYPLTLQGCGAGDDLGAGGTHLDGSAFNYQPYYIEWSGRITQKVTELSTWSNGWWNSNANPNKQVSMGAVVYVLGAEKRVTGLPNVPRYNVDNYFTLDGFNITGGNIYGHPTSAVNPNQGGALYIQATVPFARITNNIFQNNMGSLGALRVGTPALVLPRDLSLQNIVPNPSAEVLDEVTQLPVGWVFDAWRSVATGSVVRDSHAGTFALQTSMTTANGGDAKWMSPPMQLGGPSAITCSCWYKSSTQISFELAFTLADGTIQYIGMTVGAAAPLSYTQISGTTNSPAGTVSAQVWLIISADNSWSIVDDFKCTSQSGVVPAGNVPTIQYGAKSNNQNLVFKNNRLINNGGVSRAGALGIFAGSDSYEVAYNDICGSYTTEYGGGMSHYGASNNGKIHHNRFYFNTAFDEGGCLIVSTDTSNAQWDTLASDAGTVSINDNLFQACLSNDDGGAIRLNNPGTKRITINNNYIVNNVATHEGGGISMSDASDVVITSNTIAYNMATASSTVDMTPDTHLPAGLSSQALSGPLKQQLGLTVTDTTLFAKPTLNKNIFWENRAAATSAAGVTTGLGAPFTGTFHFDMGCSSPSDCLFAPTNTAYQTQDSSPSNVAYSSTNQVDVDPVFAAPYGLTVSITSSNNGQRYTQLVVANPQPNVLGSYQVTSTVTGMKSKGVQGVVPF